MNSSPPHAIHDEIYIPTFVLLGSWLINENNIENSAAFCQGRRTDCESEPFVSAMRAEMCCFRFSLNDGLWTRTRGENIHELCNLIKLWLCRNGNPNKTVQPWLWTLGQPQQFKFAAYRRWKAFLVAFLGFSWIIHSATGLNALSQRVFAGFKCLPDLNAAITREGVFFE